jgi:hypothetical protein
VIHAPSAPPVAVPAEAPDGRRSDRRFLLGFGLALLLLTSLPYAFGYLTAPADQQFMGLTYTVHDYSQYMSWARESATGILVPNKLTPEPNPPVFFNLLWWIIGRLDHYLGISFVVANQGLRVVAAGLFMLLAYRFCAVFFPDRPRRRFALVTACLMGGFGWLLVVLKQKTGTLIDPTLVYNTPGNTFFGMMVVPHQIISAALLLAILLLVLRAYPRASVGTMAAAGAIALALGLEHTYDLVTAYTVLAVFAALVTLRDGLRWRWVLAVAVFYLISAPAPLFWFHLDATNPEWREVLAQYQNLGVFTPGPLGLLVLLGPVFLVSLATYRGFLPLASQSDRDLLLNGWFVSVLFLIYLPVNFQIMMLNGVQVALAVLATRGWFDHGLPWLAPRLAAWPGALSLGPDGRRRWSAVVLAGFLALTAATNVYLGAWRLVDERRHAYPEFLYRDDVAALNWLAAHVQGNDVVLSSMNLGYYVPGWTGAHAFLAHGADTLDFVAKRAMVQQFYAADTPTAARLQTLQRFNVRYVIDGPSERSLGSFDPRSAPYLQPVFQTARTTVYAVVGPMTAGP